MSPLHPIQQTLGYRLGRACRAHRNHVAASFEPIGIYVGQELILVQLWAEEGVTQSCLAERVGVDASTMTKTLQRLERHGLVQRCQDSQDTRVSRVYLTDEGRALELPITNAWNEIEHHTFAGLTEEECGQLDVLLQRIEDNLV